MGTVVGLVGVWLLGSGLAIAQPSSAATAILAASQASTRAVMAPSAPSRRKPASTTDHRKFEVLKQPFKTGPDVTVACLSCHTEASKQIMKTSHWTWLSPGSKPRNSANGLIYGKAQNIINNFCVALPSNEPRCTSCHIGYGWKDKSFDFGDEKLVDCLVCHDTTRTYKKFPTDAGHPAYVPKEFPKGSGKIWEPPDLSLIAQNVGPTSRATCGTCHFFGGGGEGVKHGDMDESLGMPSRGLDVHMNAAGTSFECTQCHTTVEHQVAGRSFDVPAVEERHFVMTGKDPRHNYLACESCHGERPHKRSLRNHHAEKLACQACHVPTIARERPTKMWWDWSKAGQMGPDGKPQITYTTVKGMKVTLTDTQKGEFIWIKDEKPEYRWYNGKARYVLAGQKIDDRTPASEVGIARGLFDKLDLAKPVVRLNVPQGDAGDPRARIWPVKVHRGVQPYDTENKTLVIPKLFGPPGSGAYWSEYDWGKAIETGMRYSEQPYSGKYGWIQTELTIPIAHMVAPEGKSVGCDECHAPNGRLAGIEGVYLPGRDSSRMVEILGLIAIAGAALAAVGHGALRVVSQRSRQP